MDGHTLDSQANLELPLQTCSHDVCKRLKQTPQPNTDTNSKFSYNSTVKHPSQCSNCTNAISNSAISEPSYYNRINGIVNHDKSIRSNCKYNGIAAPTMSGTTENSPSLGNNKANQVQPYYQAENNQSTSKQFLNKSTSTTDSFRGQQNGKTTKENTSFPNVCANFTAYMTKNTVNVSINNRKSSALCDTGASVSCISKQFFDKAFLNDKPNINPCHMKYIFGVGGTNHQVLGVVEINVNFGTLGLTYPFYVVEELHHSIILGHDFLEAHSVTLDIRGKKNDNTRSC